MNKSYFRVRPTGCNHEVSLICAIDIGVVVWQPNVLWVNKEFLIRCTFLYGGSMFCLLYGYFPIFYMVGRVQSVSVYS